MNDVAVNESKLTRVEVIDKTGRAYVHWDANFNVELSIQDNQKTLKIFITSKKK